MSAKNKLSNKKARREERTARKNAFKKQMLLDRIKKATPSQMFSMSTSNVDSEEAREARMAEKGFVVAHKEDLLWKPGDED